MAYTELSVDQGSTFETTIDIKQDDGTAINLSGFSFAGQIRKSYYSTNPTASFTITPIVGSVGTITVSLNAATTANIRPGRYLYDIKMTDTGAKITRVIEGIITITPQVTR
jgi:hypothetical protein